MPDAHMEIGSNVATLPGPAKGIVAFLNNLVDQTKPQSTKRAMAILGAVTLCLCAFILTCSVIWQAIFRGNVDVGLASVVLGSQTSVGLLTGISYRKADSSKTELPKNASSPAAGDPS